MNQTVPLVRCSEQVFTKAALWEDQVDFETKI